MDRAVIARAPERVVIHNDDVAILSIQDAAVSERDFSDGHTTAMTFTIELDKPVPQSIFFVFSTADDAAFAGEGYDYVGRSITVTMPANTTSIEVQVEIYNDDHFTDDRAFLARLTGLAAAGFDVQFGDGEATGTILEDEWWWEAEP